MQSDRRAAEPCVALPWDTTFFGFPVARTLLAEPLAPGVKDILGWCEDRGVRCLYHLSDAESVLSNAAVEAKGFVLVDVRHELELDVKRLVAQGPAGSPPLAVRLRTSSRDVGLRALASAALRNSRFARDPGFPADRVGQLPDRWLDRAMERGRVFAAEEGGVSTGLVSLEPEDDGGVRIGILGVDPVCQSRGVGRGLLAAAVQWAAENGYLTVRVATQGRAQSLRTYENMGFRTSSVHVWHHRWFS